MKKEKLILTILSILILATVLYDARLGLVASLIGMVVYTYIYLKTKDPSIKKKRIWALVMVSFLVAVLIVVNLRFFSGEDDWICDNGKWVQHGHPDAPMPTEQCK